MSVRDPKAWMPKDMLDADKDYFLTEHPNDPHMAAAVAWEAWGAHLADEPIVSGVHTGAQAISYAKGYAAAQSAMERASWHRSRSKVMSVVAGPKYEFTLSEWQGEEIKTVQMTPWWEES